MTPDNRPRPWMREQRNRINKSLQAVAKECGVSRQEVSAWEIGVRTPQASRIMFLAHSLGLTVDDVARELAKEAEMNPR